MGLFDRIKEKLGLGGVSNEAHKPTSTAPTSASTSNEQGATLTSNRPSATDNATLAPGQDLNAAPAHLSQVDVAAKLDSMAASHPEKLNWRTSIVDLLKLLGLDSSLESRRELAVELGCPAEKMSDSAQMNMWLHREVLKRVADHGGSVPPELLH
ncbi:DUF3597 domain-containing protein [Stutzerimonas balearica]|uniref:DUF3597 domain-containing protein n=1 Tax=Stutzerimonas balearica TaxID=74829 RepID=UPI003F5AF433